jgi:hypothetical protein
MMKNHKRNNRKKTTGKPGIFIILTHRAGIELGTFM